MDLERSVAPEKDAVSPDSSPPRPAGSDGVGTIELEVGSEIYHQLLAGFLGHLSLQVAELNNAAEVGDVRAARYVAHQFKGTAPSFGAVELDELADRVLQIGEDQDGVLRSLVDDIVKEVGHLQAVLGP